MLAGVLWLTVCSDDLCPLSVFSLASIPAPDAKPLIRIFTAPVLPIPCRKNAKVLPLLWPMVSAAAMSARLPAPLPLKVFLKIITAPLMYGVCVNQRSGLFRPVIPGFTVRRGAVSTPGSGIKAISVLFRR